ELRDARAPASAFFFCLHVDAGPFLRLLFRALAAFVGAFPLARLFFFRFLSTARGSCVFVGPDVGGFGVEGGRRFDRARDGGFGGARLSHLSERRRDRCRLGGGAFVDLAEKSARPLGRRLV